MLDDAETVQKWRKKYIQESGTPLAKARTDSARYSEHIFSMYIVEGKEVEARDGQKQQTCPAGCQLPRPFYHQSQRVILKDTTPNSIATKLLQCKRVAYIYNPNLWVL